MLSLLAALLLIGFPIALLLLSWAFELTPDGIKPTAEVAPEQFDVRYLLEGSVRSAGNQLRIIAQLIDAT